MDGIKAFGQRLLKAAQNIWEGFKKLPIVKPLYGLLYSRKSMISVAAVGFILEVFPKLAPAHHELEVVTAQVVGIIAIAIAQSLGIAVEDAAEKSKVVAGG